MPDTLARTGAVVPKTDGSDSTTAYRISARSLGLLLEGKALLFYQGLLSARPAAGTGGVFYKPTDTGLETIAYYDNGTVWQTIGATPPTDPAANVAGLRTLGAGAQQAAAGNHTHDTDLLARLGAL